MAGSAGSHFQALQTGEKRQVETEKAVVRKRYFAMMIKTTNYKTWSLLYTEMTARIRVLESQVRPSLADLHSKEKKRLETRKATMRRLYLSLIIKTTSCQSWSLLFTEMTSRIRELDHQARQSLRCLHLKEKKRLETEKAAVRRQFLSLVAAIPNYAGWSGLIAKNIRTIEDLNDRIRGLDDQLEQLLEDPEYGQLRL